MTPTRPSRRTENSYFTFPAVLPTRQRMDRVLCRTQEDMRMIKKKNSITVSNHERLLIRLEEGRLPNVASEAFKINRGYN
jgi:hypothetical protein